MHTEHEAKNGLRRAHWTISRFVPVLLTCALSCAPAAAGSAEACETGRVRVQVLGSGGPEIQDRRASASYLVWVDDRARVMVDAGGGSSLNFERSGARFEDLDAIAITHVHVDHSAELPVYVKSWFLTDRDRELIVLGPDGTGRFPAIEDVVHAMLGSDDSAYPYLSSYLTQDAGAAARLRAQALRAGLEDAQPQRAFANDRVSLTAIAVSHGPVPALAWRVEAAGCSITFSGDMSGRSGNLPKLAAGSDLLVAHNAAPEGVTGVARNLHMPPSVIGRIAAEAQVGALILSHRMRRTLGREAQTESAIRENYDGLLAFANDLDAFAAGASSRWIIAGPGSP